MKVYIHHYYTDKLFYLLAHNTTDRIFELTDNCGSVKCKYKNVDFEFIFKLDFSNEADGLHLIDFTTIKSQYHIDAKIKKLNNNNSKIDEITIINNLAKEINKSNWIFTFFCGEKSLFNFENINDKNIETLTKIEDLVVNLKKCKIIFEEVFLKNEIKKNYENFYYLFTNGMWFWNNRAEIRWFYEYNKIHSKLNFDYNLGYSVRAYKSNRILLLNELKNLNRNDLYLQRSDERKPSENYIKYEHKVSDIYLNSIEGINDFDNLKLLSSQKQRYEGGIFGLDLFFRVLPKAKMHILDESWAFYESNFLSHYISEKTIGFILAGIPFISTHSYPLEIVEKILKVPPHPFIKQSREIQGNAVLIAKFVDEFMNNFDENFKLCKNWIDECHNVFIKKLNNENSLLDLILKDFNVEDKEYVKILI